ncbi:MAG TPA: radical SAM protein [Candidatus Polarisedimenticolia bacterium]|jgi:MoaA/NifB/PqqE/SkfB family radical SAM enzyme
MSKLLSIGKVLRGLVREPSAPFRTAASLLTHRPAKPLYVGIYVTYRCNSRCRTCDIWMHEGRDEPRHAKDNELSSAELRRLVDELASLGTRQIGLWGGDALLREDLEEVISHASRHGIGTGVSFNGMYMSEERARSLVDAGLSRLDVSVDGPDAELHNHARGLRLWDKMIAGVNMAHEAARAAGRELKIGVNTVINRRNIGVLDRMIDLKDLFDFRDLGFDLYVAKFFRGGLRADGSPVPLMDRFDAGPAEAEDPLKIRIEEIELYHREVLPRLEEKALRREVSLLNPRPFELGSWGPESILDRSYGKKVYERTYCFVPWYHAVIAGPEVAPCTYAEANGAVLSMGNLRQQTFTEIWRGEKYRAFRSAMKPPSFDFCGNCSSCRPYGQYVGENVSYMKYYPLKVLVREYLQD